MSHDLSYPADASANTTRYPIPMPTDARGELQDGRFSYRQQKDGRVVVSWYGRPVTTLAGQEAERFLSRVGGADDQAAQLLMARVTGNFKRGNERH